MKIIDALLRFWETFTTGALMGFLVCLALIHNNTISADNIGVFTPVAAVIGFILAYFPKVLRQIFVTLKSWSSN